MQVLLSMGPTRRSAWVLTVLLACGPQVGPGDEARPGDSDGSTSSATTTADSNGPDSTSGPDSTTGVGTISTSTTTPPPDNTFVDPEDVPSPECDLWTGEPCVRGEKCMPYAHGGGEGWNSTKCTPLAPNPGRAGDPCTVEDSPHSGIDDCEAFSMCWGVDPDTNQGTCVSFCTGSALNPSCDDPATSCMIGASELLMLCLPTCDPLAQTCVEGQGCYGWGETFLCMGGHGHAAPGEPCEFVNACEPGSYCASAADLSGCQGASGCCAPFCDVNAVDPCPGAAEGVECVPWFHEGQVHPSLENVGGCVGPW